MKKGFVVSAILYPLLVIALTLILGVVAMSDNRRKILDNMKLEVSEESETDPEMSNSSLYYKLQVLQEAYLELSARLSEERFEEMRESIKNKIKLESYTIGSIFISTGSANPSSYIGGTWVAYGRGRTLVGVGSNGTSSYSVGATGGSETHNHSGTIGETTLTVSQIPIHTHSISTLSGITSSNGIHTHSFLYNDNYYSGWPYSGKVGQNINFFLGDSSGTKKTGIADNGAHIHEITMQTSVTESKGGNNSHVHSLNSNSEREPYQVVYMWKRVA